MKNINSLILTLVFSFLLSIPNTLKGQTLDSLSESYTNGNLSVYLNVFDVYGFQLSDVNYQKVNDTLTVNICIANGFTAATHSEDTTLQISMPLAPNHYIVNLRNDINCSNLISSEYFPSDITTSIVQKSSNINNSINLYPNPTTGSINLNVTNNSNISSIELYDVTGRKVKMYKNSERKLKTNGLINGQYFLKIESEKGLIIKKVLIE